MHHTVKIHAALYPRVKSGEKRFEVRKDDRNYQCGDTLTMEYFDPDISYPSPPMPDRDPLEFRIGFVLRGGQYGIEPGYVAFQLEPMENVDDGIPDCADPGAEPWRMHDGSNIPPGVRGVTSVEVRYRNGNEETLTGADVMPEYNWKWGRLGRMHSEQDIVTYRVPAYRWTMFDGGCMPPVMHPNLCVDIRLRDGSEFRTNFPQDLAWAYDGMGTDREIVAYRIV